MAAHVPCAIVNRSTVPVPRHATSGQEKMLFLNILLPRTGQSASYISREVLVGETVSPTKVLLSSKTRDDVARIDLLYRTHQALFSTHSREAVLEAFRKIASKLPFLSLDMHYIDFDIEEECLYVYGQQGSDKKFFFNLFFDSEKIDALVTISIAKHPRVVEGSVEEGLRQLMDCWNGK